ncbi:hypothetical protein O181_062562 [Austropuccinia psidii MF-1]|uniref:Uncharacterized protein n=1 Tax=Austropuccinia psidii MF-1 TaxID=1389203 RepID=A0A9Q3EMV9_9BASI|nr:hypothetical protein [Austropuccinia psidii MF-1]
MEAQSNAEKYKSVLKKVRQVNEAMPKDLNLPLKRPELSRYPYETPLSPNPPLFIETSKATEERISIINFGPSGWLSEEETNLLKNVILLREQAIAFCEEERVVLTEERISIIDFVPSGWLSEEEKNSLKMLY